jgi:signal transduction histidine kinase
MSGPESNQDRVRPGKRIPGVPDCLQHLLAVAQQRSSSLQQLAAAVEQDPALLYDYLRLARTGDLANWYETYNHEFARVIALSRGLDLLRDMEPLIGSDRVRLLWRQSLGTALLNRELAGCLFSSDPSSVKPLREAYLVGLLSHIGELANCETQHIAGVSPGEIEVQAETSEISAEETQTDMVLSPEAEVTDGAVRSADMLAGLLDDPLLVDAIRFRDQSVDSLADAHWLVRSLAVSNTLVSLVLEPERPAQQLEYKLCNQLLGISARQVDESVTRAKRLLADILVELGGPISVAETEAPQAQIEHSSMLRRTIVDSSALAVVANLLEGSGDMTGWWRNVQLIGRLVFGVGDGFLFRLDKKTHQLVSTAPATHQFSVSMDNPRSILPRAVINRCVSTTKDDDLAIVDQQLVGLAKAEALLCVPLLAAGEVTGALAFGVLKRNTEPLVSLHGLLERFAELVGEHYERRLIASALSKESPRGIDHEYLQVRAREVTHEINNPLSVVQNYMKILSLKLGEDSSVQSDLKTISEEINRISGIVKKFSQIASESEIGASVLNLNEVVNDIVGVFRGSAPDVRFVLRLEDNIPRLDVSRDSIKQVLVNLLKNALEAMGNKGNIVVTTTAGVNLGGEIYVEILVSDDGPGISREARERLFREVNTSKGPAHGGLGLTIVKKLIDEMDGYISCRSGVDTGTDFQILLPVRYTENNE